MAGKWKGSLGGKKQRHYSYRNGGISILADVDADADAFALSLEDNVYLSTATLFIDTVHKFNPNHIRGRKICQTNHRQSLNMQFRQTESWANEGG